MKKTLNKTICKIRCPEHFLWQVYPNMNLTQLWLVHNSFYKNALIASAHNDANRSTNALRFFSEALKNKSLPLTIKNPSL